MAWQFPVSTSVSGTAVPLGDFDSVFVATGVLVASTNSFAIYGSGSNHQAVIAGTAASDTVFTVILGGRPTDHDNSITVEAGGEIRSFGGPAIAFIGYDNDVSNSGLIYAKDRGILLNGASANAVTSIVNSGTIVAGGIGIARYALSTEAITFTNSGTLSAPTAYGPYAGDSVARDVINNTGRISGNIDLGGGNDSYFGTTGHLTGKLFGGAGADVAYGGIDNNWFEGGADHDTLIGNAGLDTLKGDAGQDKLYGGHGNDALTGGIGVDYFIFNTTPNAAANRDTVADFVHGGDKFWMENAVFTKLGAAGALNPNFFRLGPTALDANDHIVYNHTTGDLYYDGNGSAAGAAVLFATLTTKPILSAPDFVVI